MIHDPKQLEDFWNRTSQVLGLPDLTALENSPQRNEFFLNGVSLAAEQLGGVDKVSEAHTLQIYKNAQIAWPETLENMLK
jgi:hypothetical protein